MISLFRKYKESGFSLIEAMVGLGLMTAVGVGVMQLQSNQVKTQKSIDVDYEAKILASVIYDQLKTKGACEATFRNSNFASGNFSFSSITDGAGNVLFSAPQDYKGQNNIGILRFVAEPQSFSPSEDPLFREGSVRVAFEYQKTSSVLNNQNNYKKYISLPIRVRVLASNGSLHSCVTAADSEIETSLKTFCESLNGAYDVATELCSLDSTGSATSEAHVDGAPDFQGAGSSNLGYGFWDHKISDNYIDKIDGGVITGDVRAVGNIILNVSPAGPRDAINKAFLDSRLRCPTGQVGFMTATGPVCRNLLCNNPLEYLAGINTDGSGICNPLVTSSENCGNGGRLNVQNNGSVGFECCTPVCDGAGARCSSESFPSSNGCGLCQGTAPSVVEGTWTPWVDTGETRQTSECINNQIQTEKRQVRTCVANTTLASCQELNCAGSDGQWTAGVPINCGSTGWACSAAQTVPGDGSVYYAHATNVRMEPFDWQQRRPSWPISNRNGNSWQQGYHSGCIESCRAEAKTRYATSIISENGDDKMRDANMTVSVGVADIFFQERSSYNSGPPNKNDDNSGWWCACYMKLHNKTDTLTFSQHMLQRSEVDSQQERAALCTLNGEGGTPIGPPSPPTCTPSKTCSELRAETCTGTYISNDECGNSCGFYGTRNCATCPATRPACPANTYDMGADEGLCNSGHQCLEGCYKYGNNCQNINVCWRRSMNGFTCPLL